MGEFLAEFSLQAMGNRLKLVRADKGYGGENQMRAFCRKYDLNPSEWSKLERGIKPTVYIQTLVDWANKFNVSPTWLLFDIGRQELSLIKRMHQEKAAWERRAMGFRAVPPDERQKILAMSEGGLSDGRELKEATDEPKKIKPRSSRNHRKKAR